MSHYVPERRPLLAAGRPPPLHLIVHDPLCGTHAGPSGYFNGPVHEVQSEVHLGGGLEHGLGGGRGRGVAVAAAAAAAAMIVVAGTTRPSGVARLVALFRVAGSRATAAGGTAAAVSQSQQRARGRAHASPASTRSLRASLPALCSLLFSYFLLSIHAKICGVRGGKWLSFSSCGACPILKYKHKYGTAAKLGHIGKLRSRRLQN